MSQDAYSKWISHQKVLQKVCATLLLLNDVTSQPISHREVQVFCEERVEVIHKEDGWVCLMNLSAGEHHICLRGTMYQAKNLCIDIGNQENFPLLMIRMMPNDRYPMPSDAICLSGKVYPYQRINLLIRPEGSEWKLLQSYQGGRLLQVYSPFLIYMEGRHLCLNGHDLCTIQETEEAAPYLYRLEQNLSAQYPRGYTNIDLFYEAQADKMGNFFFATCLPCEKVLCQIQVLQGGWLPQLVHLQSGQQMKLHMKEEEIT